MFKKWLVTIFCVLIATSSLFGAARQGDEPLSLEQAINMLIELGVPNEFARKIILSLDGLQGKISINQAILHALTNSGFLGDRPLDESTQKAILSGATELPRGTGIIASALETSGELNGRVFAWSPLLAKHSFCSDRPVKYTLHFTKQIDRLDAFEKINVYRVILSFLEWQAHFFATYRKILEITRHQHRDTQLSAELRDVATTSPGGMPTWEATFPKNFAPQGVDEVAQCLKRIDYSRSQALTDIATLFTSEDEHVRMLGEYHYHRFCTQHKNIDLNIKALISSTSAIFISTRSTTMTVFEKPDVSKFLQETGLLMPLEFALNTIFCMTLPGDYWQEYQHLFSHVQWPDEYADCSQEVMGHFKEPFGLALFDPAFRKYNEQREYIESVYKTLKIRLSRLLSGEQLKLFSYNDGHELLNTEHFSLDYPDDINDHHDFFVRLTRLEELIDRLLAPTKLEVEKEKVVVSKQTGKRGGRQGGRKGKNKRKKKGKVKAQTKIDSLAKFRPHERKISLIQTFHRLRSKRMTYDDTSRFAATFGEAYFAGVIPVPLLYEEQQVKAGEQLCTIRPEAYVFVYTPNLNGMAAETECIQPASTACPWLETGDFNYAPRVENLKLQNVVHWPSRARRRYIQKYRRLYGHIFKTCPLLSDEEKDRRLILEHIPADFLFANLFKHGIYTNDGDRISISLPARIVFPNGNLHKDDPVWPLYRDGVYTAGFSFDETSGRYVCNHFCFSEKTQHELIKEFIEQGRWILENYELSGSGSASDDGEATS